MPGPMDKPILTRNALNIKICHFNDLEIQLHLNIKKNVFLDAIFKCQYKEYNFLSVFLPKRRFIWEKKKNNNTTTTVVWKHAPLAGRPRAREL